MGGGIAVHGPAVDELARSIGAGETVITTGPILQELLQGFSGPALPERIIERFSALPMLVPNRRDHIDAAALKTHCRRNGVGYRSPYDRGPGVRRDEGRWASEGVPDRVVWAVPDPAASRLRRG